MVYIFTSNKLKKVSNVVVVRHSLYCFMLNKENEKEASFQMSTTETQVSAENYVFLLISHEYFSYCLWRLMNRVAEADSSGVPLIISH